MHATTADDEEQAAIYGPARPLFDDLPEHMQRMSTSEAPMSEADRALIRNLLPWVSYPAKAWLLAPPLTSEAAALIRGWLWGDRAR